LIYISRALIYHFCFPKEDTQRNARVAKAMVNSMKHNVRQNYLNEGHDTTLLSPIRSIRVVDLILFCHSFHPYGTERRVKWVYEYTFHLLQIRPKCTQWIDLMYKIPTSFGPHWPIIRVYSCMKQLLDHPNITPWWWTTEAWNM